MVTGNKSVSLRIGFCLGVFLSLAGATGFASAAQAPAPAAPVAASPAASASELGTVKTVAGSTITMATDAGQAVTVNVASGAKVVQLAVGSTDLKTATASQLSDIAVGDRVLAIGRAGDAAASFNALRVVLMKSSDIAQRQADWKARGVGGIVNAVDPATGAITIILGAKKIVVDTTGKTVFRRFVGDSVKYEDAKPGTLAQIQKNDQLQARGAKSADGLSIAAEEVLSGSFKNLGPDCQHRPGGEDDYIEGPGNQEGDDRGCDGEVRHTRPAVDDGDALCRADQWRRAGRWTRRRWTWGRRRGVWRFGGGTRGCGRRSALGWSGPVADDLTPAHDRAGRPEEQRCGDDCGERADARIEHGDRDYSSFRSGTDSDREPEWRHGPVDEPRRRGWR